MKVRYTLVLEYEVDPEQDDKILSPDEVIQLEKDFNEGDFYAWLDCSFDQAIGEPIEKIEMVK